METAMVQMLAVWLYFCILSIGFLTDQKDSSQIPPDHAQVEGVILSRFGRNNAHWALMKIMAIKGYGSGFRSALNPNDTIEVKLAFISTEKGDTGPSINDTFSGNIKQGISELNSSKTTTYEINDYTKFN